MLLTVDNINNIYNKKDKEILPRIMDKGLTKRPMEGTF